MARPGRTAAGLPRSRGFGQFLDWVAGLARIPQPPIPPRATFEQMKSAAQAVLRGDPNALHLLAQGVKTKLQEFVPGRRGK